ncbi:MAG: TolC family protein [Bacteroidales bacterium]|nr:TolC family protein [Bacteroidales bacterium]HQH40388.1 TolC family protein [Bacteroidales bacterium]
MKTLRSILPVIFLLTAALFKGYPQEPWSLEKCVRYALENNIQIKQQQLNSEYAGNNLLQSKMSLLPTINASAAQSKSFGRALDQTTYTFTQNQTITSLSSSVNANLVVFNGLQKINLIRQSRFDLMASLQQLEKLKNDLALNVAAAYLQILFNMELLNSAQQQAEVTRQQVERTAKLVDAGSLPMGNLLEIQAQHATEEVQIVNYQNQLDISYLTLAQLLELKDTEGFRIEIPDFSDFQFKEVLDPVADIYQDALRNLPQIKIAEYQLKSSEAGLSVARGGRSPRLFIAASYGTGYSDIRQRIIGTTPQTIPIGATQGGELVYSQIEQPIYDTYPLKMQLKDNASTTLTFGLSVPLFNGWSVNTQVSNARLNVQNARYNLDLSKNLLYKDIQQAHADALAAVKRYLASEKSLEAQKESFKYVQQKYEVGLVTTVDFNTAKTSLARAESELLQAKYDYLFRINILNFYRGNPLTVK